MLLGWIIEIISRMVTYNEKRLFYKSYKDVLTKIYYSIVLLGTKGI